jgi:hypothetical protein
MINDFLSSTVGLDDDQKKEAVRTMDKRDKLSKEEFQEILI